MKPRAAAARGGLRGERQRRACVLPTNPQSRIVLIERAAILRRANLTVRASAKTLAITGKPARETKAKQQPQRRLTLTVEQDRVSWKRPSS